MGFRNHNPWGSPDVAGAGQQVDGQPRPVSISGVVYSPPAVVVAAATATPIPLGVASARQVTIQNNSGQPINRSYSGPASAASLVIPNGVQQIDTVTSTTLSLYGTAGFTVNGGANGVVVEVYS